MSDSEKKLFDIISQKYEYEIMRDGPLNVKHQDLDFVGLKRKKKKLLNGTVAGSEKPLLN